MRSTMPCIKRMRFVMYLERTMLRSQSPRVLLWQLATVRSSSRCGWCAMSCPEVHCGLSCTSAPWAPHSLHVRPQPDWCISATLKPRLGATPCVQPMVVREQVQHIAATSRRSCQAKL